MAKRQDLRNRFWGKVAIGHVDQCWNWTGHVGKWGYGKFKVGQPVRTVTASRIAWMLANELDIPRGENVLHSCDNPPCCNPAHLSLGTLQENSRQARDRGRVKMPWEMGIPNWHWQSQKTHCKKGHGFVGENLFYDHRGKRQCRTCQTERNRRKYENKKRRQNAAKVSA